VNRTEEIPGTLALQCGEEVSCPSNPASMIVGGITNPKRAKDDLKLTKAIISVGSLTNSSVVKSICS